MGETGSTSAAPPAISRSTFPRQHRPYDFSILQRGIHLIKIKDTRPQNQLSAAQEQPLRSWVWTLKELKSFIYFMSTTLPNLSIPGTHFLVC